MPALVEDFQLAGVAGREAGRTKPPSGLQGPLTFYLLLQFPVVR